MDPHPPTEPADHLAAPRLERICAKCNYNLSGLDPHGRCPECGENIINNCFKCGYELTGLDPAGPCPECGFPIEGSIGRGELSHADPAYLATLHKGVFLIQTAILLMVLQVIITIGMGFASGVSGNITWMESTPFIIFSQGIGLIFSVMLLIGWWKFSAENPDTSDRYSGGDARKLVRVMIAISAALTVINIPFAFIPQTGEFNALFLITMILGLLGVIVLAVRFFAEMFYIRWMAPLLRNKRVYKRASTLLWLGPLLCTVGLILLGLGPLIALVLYWNMLDWIRKDLKSIRHSAGAIA